MECGAGYTRKALIQDGDDENELKMITINGVDMVYASKLSDTVKNEDSDE